MVTLHYFIIKITGNCKAEVISCDILQNKSVCRREREREKPKKKYKFWDIPPDGYEHLTPKEYKELQGNSFIFDRTDINRFNFISFKMLLKNIK